MPTVQVMSSPLTASARLKAALRLTKWFCAHGSDPAHVVVLFQTAAPMTYFAGGVPLTRFDDEDGEQRCAQWASVVCHVHHERDHAYRADLAEEVRASVGLADGHCLVRFEPTDPERVFYLHNGVMTDSAPPMVGTAQKGR